MARSVGALTRPPARTRAGRLRESRTGEASTRGAAGPAFARRCSSAGGYPRFSARSRDTLQVRPSTATGVSREHGRRCGSLARLALHALLLAPGEHDVAAGRDAGAQLGDTVMPRALPSSQRFSLPCTTSSVIRDPPIVRRQRLPPLLRANLIAVRLPPGALVLVLRRSPRSVLLIVPARRAPALLQVERRVLPPRLDLRRMLMRCAAPRVADSPSHGSGAVTADPAAHSLARRAPHGEPPANDVGLEDGTADAVTTELPRTGAR